MKYIRIAFITIVSVLLFCSCNKENESIYGKLSFNKTEFELSAKEADAQAYLKITSTYKWEASYDAAWLSMSVTKGEAGSECRSIISAKTNTERENRVATITVKSGLTEEKITVTQLRGHISITKEEIQDYDKIYVPKEYENEKFFSSEGKWFFGRSAQSEHFIVFWEPGYDEYGDITPSQCSSSKYRVNIDELLSWAEKCFDKYVKELKFSDLGSSILDIRKIDIFLQYSTTWAAYGSGLENNVGCLWINPDAANSQATVAHEIGHSFQYIVGCDLLYNKTITDASKGAFRYDIGQGNGFWEQTSQWMAAKMVPSEAFGNWYFNNSDGTAFCPNAFRHFLHETMRYGSFYFHYYMTDKYGVDAVGKVWKGARSPKDALQVYQEVFDLSIDEFNAQMYDYASKVVTWDFTELREEGINKLNKISWKGESLDDGYIRVKPAVCPEAMGFNIIRFNEFAAGGEVSIDFIGLPNESGYNSSGDASKSGWRIGFVALGSDGSTRYYSDAAVATAATENHAVATWTVPADAKRLWAVVAATPTTYISHKWDENNSNDLVWPYKIKVDGGVVAK